jgi:hypothetical protein
MAAAGLAAASLLATAVLASAALVRIATNAYGATGDFLSFYVAGGMVREGRGGDLYDPIVQEALQRSAYPGRFDDAIGYPLPVFAAWMFAPFSALPFTVAFFAWMTLNAALLGVLAWLLARHLRDVPALPRRIFLAVFACSMPAVTTIVFGQVDLTILVGLFGGYVLHREGRPYAAGAALALALLKPHFLGGVVLMLLVWRDWRTIAALCGIALPLLTLPALLTDRATLAGNLSYVGKYPGDAAATDISINADKMSNWRGFVVSATGSGEAWLWLPGLALIALVALALCVRAWRRGDAEQSWALALLLPLLVSPHLHTQSLVLMFLPLALGMRRLAAAPDTNWTAVVRWTLLLFTALFACWLATAIGLALLAFVVLGVAWWCAFRWPANARAAAPHAEIEREAA